MARFGTCGPWTLGLLGIAVLSGLLNGVYLAHLHLNGVPARLAEAARSSLVAALAVATLLRRPRDASELEVPVAPGEQDGCGRRKSPTAAIFVRLLSQAGGSWRPSRACLSPSIPYLLAGDQTGLRDEQRQRLRRAARR